MLCCPCPNILFKIQFIIAFASQFQVRTSHMRSPTYSNALYKKAQVSQEALPSSIYKLLCFTPQWKPCEIPAQCTNGVTSDPAPALATPTPSDSPCTLWGLLSWHFPTRKVDKESVRERTGIRRGASWVISMRTKGTGHIAKGQAVLLHICQWDKTLWIKRKREPQNERGSDGRQATGGATRKEKGVWGASVLIEWVTKRSLNSTRMLGGEKIKGKRLSHDLHV